MSDRTVFDNIMKNLGGNRFTAMTGAKGFVYGDNYALFSLPARFATNKCTRVKITLEPNDTYTVEFGKIVKYEWCEISRHEGIYNDMLRELFTRETGLDTHL